MGMMLMMLYPSGIDKREVVEGIVVDTYDFAPDRVHHRTG